MSKPVLSQLQSVEAELVTQESRLLAQLAAVQEKLNGIRAVIPMFSEVSDSRSEPAKAQALAPVAEEKTAVPAVAEPESKLVKTTASKRKTQQKKTNKAKATAKKKTTKTKVAKKKTTVKKDGRTATLQKYTRPGVKNASIPDAVRLILETQPEHEFKIAEVMDALFKETMPKVQYLKARNRISNVLSGGVRAGDWYKGQRGTYRLTDA